ncbi:tetraacyldisaccharide 4'-kinase [Marinoscillum sp. 108]|uniref:tetraacyldisaccharide 4'-kinase n=1 Tax=Marinoscillum sp. 108 TaxID=2653151 RepID=UPI0012F05AF8|nr:tetraacyldisaccharide 4'-kinase [Marinoscillum sp. 108]VXD12092.1 Tetraacyldisaccharide 4'-kinase [Marinoscillum sp. 108]
MYWWQVIVFPFALLFDLIIRLRNLLYDHGVKKTVRFDTNVVVVGNLSIGGTGKTPMIDYLVRYFQGQDKKICTLSRGYGRRTYGFRLATIADTPDTIGDEPYMYLQKYHGIVPVAVGAERDLAISELLGHVPDAHAILLDDAFQHRRVTPSVSIVLTTYENPLHRDYLLPAGRLREARRGVQRADIVVVTKCPEYMSEADQVRMRHEIQKYTSAAVYFMTVQYDPLVPVFRNGCELKRNVLGISGMANPEPFENYLHRNYAVKHTYNYRDHYRYKPADVRDILREMDEDTSLITTEKDMVKLKQFQELRDYSCFYLPIRTKFLKDESLFLSNLESKLKNYAQEPI